MSVKHEKAVPRLGHGLRSERSDGSVSFDGKALIVELYLHAVRLLFLPPPYGRTSLIVQRILLLLMLAVIGLDLFRKPRTAETCGG